MQNFHGYKMVAKVDYKIPLVGLVTASLITHLGFLTSDAVNSETSFHIIQQTEVLTSLFNGDDI